MLILLNLRHDVSAIKDWFSSCKFELLVFLCIVPLMLEEYWCFSAFNKKRLFGVGIMARKDYPPTKLLAV